MNKHPGTVYFLTNPAMPGLVKIGYTSGSLEERLRQLNTTGVPRPFQIVATFTVNNAPQCERELQQKLGHHRPSKDREFFRVSPATAIAEAISVIGKFLESAEIESVEAKTAGPVLDNDDIYFLQLILHNGYEQDRSIPTDELAEHHRAYGPLELENKLLKLADQGILERVLRSNSVRSQWRITPTGIRLMFDGGHVLQDLINESRQKA